jgi:hypothetical protein
VGENELIRCEPEYEGESELESGSGGEKYSGGNNDGPSRDENDDLEVDASGTEENTVKN